MKPVSATDMYLREQALSLAIQYIKTRQSGNYQPGYVLEIAQEFLNWLNEVEVQ